jgi:hypothetical protein
MGQVRLVRTEAPPMTWTLWVAHVAAGVPSLTEHVDWVWLLALMLGGWWW